MKIKMKKIALGSLIGVLTLGSVIGVSAATNMKKTLVSQNVIVYEDPSDSSKKAIIDGDSIGFWLKDNTGNGIGSWNGSNTNTTWEKNATLTIVDANITEDSMIDIYYSEDCKSVVAAAQVSYTQSNGKVVATFSKSSTAAQIGDSLIPVTIESIHITNPVFDRTLD